MVRSDAADLARLRCGRGAAADSRDGRADDNWDYDRTSVVNDAAKVRVNEWTQLTATCDDRTGLIALYVNGTLAGTGHHAKGNTWNATGPLVLGRYKHAGQPSSFFQRRISNVAAFNHSTVPSASNTTLVSAVSATKCADDNHGSTAEANRIQIWDCNADPGAPSSSISAKTAKCAWSASA
ncbi:LamG-like jellyroll fold domain-containing protein [Streptomyces amritsarensis]|uniref:LamG-like jellyroll fold domain-containing protein n=1 Tax=Streptomyces amritsarensis TaxID=681158 RepID=UPI0036847643